MTMSAVQQIPEAIDRSQQMASRDGTYARLMAVATGGRNSHIIASMLANWSVGESVLPERMGLSRSAYRAMFLQHFPGIQWHEDPARQGAMDFERMPERDDLIKLMLDARAGVDETEAWLAEIVAAACLGMDHLWQDMGLWSRGELSELMQRNFPALAARNDRDMKWKKFLYKQLCEQQGIYVCRAPSCDVCTDYHVCFGPEE
jgi:nitrogen fixation protein NifQ